MRKLTTALLLASIVAAGIAAAPSIYAQTNQEPSGSMMGRGMMGDKTSSGDSSRRAFESWETSMSNTSCTLTRGIYRSVLDRRTVLMGAVSTLAGCTVTARTLEVEPVALANALPPHYESMYAAIRDERFPIPAIDLGNVNPRFLRQRILYNGSEGAGTIVVDPNARFLYSVMEGGEALRYGVGIGREGFGWSGRATIERKAEWPTWTPPRSMILREPKLRRYASGMEPGLDNPLGARALYLYQDGRDTLYRLHGTNEPWSIGRAVSSGCIRLFNQDIIDLYNRTPIGSSVLVLPHGRRSGSVTL